MTITYYLILNLIFFFIFTISITIFIRRISRRLIRKATRRFASRVGRTFRRVPRRINKAFRRVSRFERTFSKTDPKVFGAIQKGVAKNMKEFLDKSEWVKLKQLKKKVKNNVALEIEREVQESPMKDMRPLIDKTIDEMINLEILKEADKRGGQLRVYDALPIVKVFWRVVLPLFIASVIIALTILYPDRIPPGSLIIPESSPAGGNPPPINPLQIIGSTLINATVFGVGALALIGLIIMLRRK
ncbi:MAG: hypothetical protein ACFFE5_11165 [Candidatus Thorarchaeota archaeon]